MNSKKMIIALISGVLFGVFDFLFFQVIIPEATLEANKTTLEAIVVLIYAIQMYFTVKTQRPKQFNFLNAFMTALVFAAAATISAVSFNLHLGVDGVIIMGSLGIVMSPIIALLTFRRKQRQTA